MVKYSIGDYDFCPVSDRSGRGGGVKHPKKEIFSCAASGASSWPES